MLWMLRESTVLSKELKMRKEFELMIQNSYKVVCWNWHIRWIKWTHPKSMIKTKTVAKPNLTKTSWTNQSTTLSSQTFPIWKQETSLVRQKLSLYQKVLTLKKNVHQAPTQRRYCLRGCNRFKPSSNILFQWSLRPMITNTRRRRYGGCTRMSLINRMCKIW